MSSINKYNGEISFNYLGREYSLRPSFGAIEAIERQLEIGFLSLIEQIAERGLTIKEQKAIWLNGLQFSGDKFSEDQLEEIFKNLGLMKVSHLSCEFIKTALATDQNLPSS